MHDSSHAPTWADISSHNPIVSCHVLNSIVRWEHYVVQSQRIAPCWKFHRTIPLYCAMLGIPSCDSIVSCHVESPIASSHRIAPRWKSHRILCCWWLFNLNFSGLLHGMERFCALANYLAAGRPGIQFASRGLIMAMAKPTDTDRERLRSGCLAACLYLSLPACLTALSVCLSVCACPCVCLHACMSACLSACVPVCLYVSLSVYACAVHPYVLCRCSFASLSVVRFVSPQVCLSLCLCVGAGAFGCGCRYSCGCGCHCLCVCGCNLPLVSASVCKRVCQCTCQCVCSRY